MSEDQAWKFEMEVRRRDVDIWKNEPAPTDMAFLVSAAKKQKTEVKLTSLTAREKQLFLEAPKQSWLDTQTVCRILRHKVPTQNILKC